jgi:DNA polymerase III epsilon subunit-like protein
MKLFYFDCETSGLDNKRHGILTLGYLIEQGGSIVQEGLLKIKPPSFILIDNKALQVNGITREQIEAHYSEIEMFHSLYDMLKSYGSERYEVVGYNVAFDLGFLKEACYRSNIPQMIELFNYKTLDIYALIRGLDYLCNWHLPNHKLGTACQFLGIPLVAHNALEDIKGTRRILEVLKGRIKYGQV